MRLFAILEGKCASKPIVLCQSCLNRHFSAMLDSLKGGTMSIRIKSARGECLRCKDGFLRNDKPYAGYNLEDDNGKK